jgi:hypothetical protein
MIVLPCAEQLAAVPELSNLGALFKSSQPVEITESETEYYVQCIKHTFGHYIVFQVRTPLLSPSLYHSVHSIKVDSINLQTLTICANYRLC